MLPASNCGRMPENRKAVAAAETAICLPLIAMLMLASIEACGMIYLDHSLSIASYEGVRIGINYDATSSEVHAKCSEMIAARNVADGTITILPADVSSAPRGTQVAVTVSAPCDSNALIPPWFFGGKTLSATTIMVKE